MSTIRIAFNEASGLPLGKGFETAASLPAIRTNLSNFCEFGDCSLWLFSHHDYKNRRSVFVRSGCWSAFVAACILILGAAVPGRLTGSRAR